MDTASAYGDAEKIIGEIAKGNKRIITKIGIESQDTEEEQLRDKIRANIERSYEDLGSKRLEGVLVHDPNNLQGREHSYGWDTLVKMKEEGYMKKIGISVYNPRQAKLLAKIYKPDIIQLPFNVFDKRAANSGILKSLKDNGIEIHARSMFLQGLLLMNIESINSYFNPWMSNIRNWHDYCSRNKLTLLEGAVTNAMAEINIDKFIVGIENNNQLEQIIDATKCTVKEYYERTYSKNDEKLIDPSKWLTDK